MKIMNKMDYICPASVIFQADITGVLCQSSLGDTGTGSLGWDGNGGFDPGGSGDDFSWGN